MIIPILQQRAKDARQTYRKPSGEFIGSGGFPIHTAQAFSHCYITALGNDPTSITKREEYSSNSRPAQAVAQ